MWVFPPIKVRKSPPLDLHLTVKRREAHSRPHLMKTRFIYQGTRNVSRADEEALAFMEEKT